MLDNRRFLDMATKLTYFAKMVALPSITLAAEEADKFIEAVWDLSRMKNNARLVKMKNQTKNVRSIGFGSGRILVPGDEFDQSKYKKQFAQNKIELSSKEFRAGVLIKDSDLEDINVGNAAQFKSTILSMCRKQIARELDEIYWIGDTHSLSGFADDDARSEVDGWRYQFDNCQTDEAYVNDVTGSCIILDASNTVTAKAADYTLSVTDGIAEQASGVPYNWEFKWTAMLKYLPPEYKLDGLKNLRFFANDQLIDNYTEALMNRSTPLGDAILTGKGTLHFGVVPVVPCPLMPVTMAIKDAGQHEFLDSDTPGDLTDLLLTHEKNLIVGIQKEIQLEVERSAADRGNYFFFTIRTDAKIEDVHAAVLLKRLKIT